MAGSLAAAEAPAQNIVQLPRMTVSGALNLDPTWQASSLLQSTSLQPDPALTLGATDTAELLRGTPGIGVVRNGPLTGIVQLRGLQNERVRLLLDGMTLSPACPNHMDPPLHYSNPSTVQAITVMAGVTPVSVGGDSIGGTVLLDSSWLRFSTNKTCQAFGGAGVKVQTANDGFGATGKAGAATDTFAASWQGGWQTGSDYYFPGGRARDTGFETQSHEVQTAFRQDDALWGVNAGMIRTRDAGTPSLPMDMVEDDGWHVGLRHEAAYGFGRLEGRLYRSEIDHLMDNFSLRPPGPMRMASPAESKDTGLRLGAAVPKNDQVFGIGLEFHRNEFDAYQKNTVSGAQQDTLQEAERNRIGGYGEWTAAWTEHWETRVGVRADAVFMDSGSLEQWFPAAAADAARFNALDPARDDLNFDATVGIRRHATDWLSLELAAARKNRAPSLLERYLWTPLSASAGQADGRTYLGNLDLDPETSHQAAFTVDLHGRTWQLKVTPFCNWVTDYIQGTPVSRLDAARLPVLQFQNVDRAELHGVDALGHWEFVPGLSLSGSLSYVRGRNCDTDDNLYRIAPLRGTVGLDAQRGDWYGGARVELAAAQHDVAAYNQETTSPGYATLGLHVGYRWARHLDMTVRVDNLLDEEYADHLSGLNRVLQSDVPVGARMPGAGRSCSVGVQWEF